MRITLIFLMTLALISCDSNKNHPDFEKNKEIAQKFIDLH